MRKDRKRKLNRLLNAGLIMMMLLITASCGDSQIEEKAPSLLEPVGVTIDTEVVKRSDLSLKVSYSGEIKAGVTELYFDVDGMVDTIPVYPGQYVEKGETLMTLDHESTQKTMDSLKASIDTKTRDGAYEDRLADLNIQLMQIELEEIAQASGKESTAYHLKQLDIEEAMMDRDQKREVRDREISSLREQLEKLEGQASEQIITAPHAGHVYYEGITRGTGVRAYRTVMYLIDPTDLTFVVDEMVDQRILENESTYAWINGQAWNLIYQPLSAEERYAYIKLSKMPPSFFKLDETDQSELPGPGASGTLLGEIWHCQDVLTVPVNALQSESGQSYVYVVENGSRVRRDVKVGYTNNIRTIITEGLEEGEIIYVQE